MILPIHAYGSKVLRKETVEIEKDYEGLNDFIDDLFETMYKAEGVGLAAPQVGKSIRIFIVDATALEEEEETLKDFKKIFINPEITEEFGEEWVYNEGCLSVPTIREDVKRHSNIIITYYDQDFNYHEEEYDGIRARIIQHEYDHLEGKVFTDHISPLRKRLLKSKLLNVSKGKVDYAYKMKLPLK